MRIYHNIPALQALNSLTDTTGALQKSIRKLSTGLRINSAADDAAGLGVSEKMRAQIGGLDQAARNSQDAVSLIQTAEGALNEVQSILQRMRELSVQAANDTLTAQDRGYIQDEIDQLTDEINRTANTTQFNKRNLLDGSSSALWSSDRLTTEAIIRGSLTGKDQFGQKISKEGNYIIELSVNPGEAQIQKSNLIRVAGDVPVKNVFEPTDPPGDPAPDADIDIGSLSDGASGTGWSFTGGVLTLSGGTYRITGQTSANRISVTGESNVILSGVDIDVSGIGASAFDIAGVAANVYLEGANSLKSGYDSANQIGHAGLEVVGSAAVTITSMSGDSSADGALAVTGGWFSAGIGGQGYVGNNGTAGSITINGGTITAQGGLGLNDRDWAPGDEWWAIDGGAGIGGGNTSSTDGGGTIVINGGHVTAVGGEGAAGIGSGVNAEGGPIGDGGTEITITGGTVNATGGVDIRNQGGAGIGGGTYSDSGVILIKGGEVTASGGPGAQGVGYGYEGIVSDVTWNSHTPEYDNLDGVEQLYDKNGVFLLASPQTITIYQGDGSSADVTLYANDTMKDVVRKINNAIAYDLGQSVYVDNAADRFCTLSDGTPGTSESVYGKDDPIYGPDGRILGYGKRYATMLVRSAIPGTVGELTFTGDENLIKAFGFATIQKSRDSEFYVSVYDAHSGKMAKSAEKISGNVAYGAITDSVDVRFDPLADTDVTWNDTMRRFDFSSAERAYKTVVHVSDNSTMFQIGANEGEDLSLSIGNMNARALGVHNVLVIDRGSASRSITQIDGAIDRVSKQRASLGAYQNRLEHTINNLTVASENLTASESRIRDLDMAREMMNFTKLNILLQSGNAMLGQANQLPQNVLSLLG